MEQNDEGSLTEGSMKRKEKAFSAESEHLLDGDDPKDYSYPTNEERKDFEEWRAEEENKMEQITNELDKISSTFSNVTRDIKDLMGQNNSELLFLKKVVSDKEDKQKVVKLHKNVEKMEEKLGDVMEEVGYGESLDVSKIPPNILEIVYQSTLDDVANELWKNLGAHVAEEVIMTTLEDIRLRTSGSELFRFDGRRIKAKDLAKSIELNLISAKQIQTTYDELLNKLLEYLPGHRAKNFRAMIKIKSQEYAVDKATILMEKYHTLSENVGNINKIIAALSSQLNARSRQLERKIEESSEKTNMSMYEKLDEFKTDILELNENKASTEDIQEIKDALKSMEEGKTAFEEKIRAMIASIRENIKGMAPKDPDKEEKDESTSMDENADARQSVIDCIGNEKLNKTMLKEKLGKKVKAKLMNQLLKELVDAGDIEKIKKGKSVHYILGEAVEEPIVDEAKEEPMDDGTPASDRPIEEDDEIKVSANFGKGTIELLDDDIPEKADEDMADELPDDANIETKTEPEMGYSDKIDEIIMEFISEKGITIEKLKTGTKGKVKYKDLLVRLALMVDEGKIEIQTKGRWTKYVRI